jgi:hypothetical protein
MIPPLIEPEPQGPVQPVLDTPSKLKRNFSANEDVQLLREVQSEKLWAASYGFISAT